MFYTQIYPDSGDINISGHVDFSVLPKWFGRGFEGIYQIVDPGRNRKQGGVIVARLEVNYLAEVYAGDEVTIETGVTRLGKSSFVVAQKVIQNKKTAAVSQVNMVYFDYAIRKSRPLPDNVRAALGEHVVGDSVLKS